jgi:hypothetical protein
MSNITLKNNETLTHRLEIDVLMVDKTARHIEVSFNGWQGWENDNSNPLEIGNSIRSFLGYGILKDATTIGYKASLHNITTGKKSCDYAPYIKDEYLQA